MVLGNRHRLELLAALAEAGDEGVNLSLLSDDQDVKASVYYAPIKDLMNMGLVDRVGWVDGKHRCRYRRRQSAIWDAVTALARAAAEFEAGVA